MAKIITMGEIMLRLSTPNYQKIVQTDNFDACYGGGEANVAVALANYGHDTEFVTKVPENSIGESAVAALRKMNVGTKYIKRGGDRLGIYFLESGASIRPSNVIYDRANSSMATATPNDFDFDEIFSDADWFHFTGITPAISDNAIMITKEALKSAKAHNVKISCDMNFRKKLWSFEKAQKVMTEFMEYVDVCFDGETILGFKKNDTNPDITLCEYKNIFEKMVEKFNFEYVISPLRISRSASDNSWSSCIYSRDSKEFYHSKEYCLNPIIDRVGGGDSFVGGTICGLLDNKNFKDALEFGAGSCALKHTIPGDFNLATREEVENLIRTNTFGRIER